MSSSNDISNTGESLSSDTVPTSNIDRSDKYKYNPQVSDRLLHWHQIKSVRGACFTSAIEFSDLLVNVDVSI